MYIQMSVDTAEVRAAFARAPKQLLMGLEEAVKSALIPIAQDAARNAPVNVGTLRQTILNSPQTRFEGDGVVVGTCGPGGNATQYARAHEYGWQPTGGSGQTGLIAGLIYWIHQHPSYFGNTQYYKMRAGKAGLRSVGLKKKTRAEAEDKAEEIAFAIMRKMYRGTAPINQPKFYMTNAWNAHKSTVVDVLSQRLAQVVDEINRGGG